METDEGSGRPGVEGKKTRNERYAFITEGALDYVLVKDK
jgi:hypothetical protein